MNNEYDEYINSPLSWSVPEPKYLWFEHSERGRGDWWSLKMQNVSALLQRFTALYSL